MGGTRLLSEVEKEIDLAQQSKEMKMALDAGISLGKDEARKEIHAMLNAYEYDERHTPSHKMLCDRMIQELREHIQKWTLKTIPWEQAKRELADAEQLSKGSV